MRANCYPAVFSKKRLFMTKTKSVSDILYVRAGLKPFAPSIRDSGGIVEFLHQYWDFKELFVPFFRGARSFWREASVSYQTDSGALGKLVNELKGSVQSHHPTHSFVGFGPRVASVLKLHNEDTSCFYPIKELALRHDFSMLLLGCAEESPGFSTVHAVQYELGLTQKHLIRYLLRWDIEYEKGIKSIVAKESPGCSLSFGKFYPEYEKDSNFIKEELLGSSYIFIPSARKAMAVEREILQANPRFVDCGRRWCRTCRFRLY